MPRKTILAFMEKSQPVSTLDRYRDMPGDEWHLQVAIVGISPASPVYTLGVPPYGAFSFPDDWHETIQADLKSVADKANDVEAYLGEKEIPGSAVTIYCDRTMLEDEIARIACVGNLAIAPPRKDLEEDLYSNLIGGILFKSPIGALVNATDINKALKPEKVFLAWNRSLQASRAVHMALPMLAQAKEVMLAIFDPISTRHLDGEDPGADAAAWLARQGCNVTVTQFPSGGHDIADGIDERAREFGADLVVMGAYGHSWLRERVFGGTTQKILEKSDRPTLLAH